MRIYITGCVGSGKSTLARQLSGLTGIRCTHLDEIIYESDPSSPLGNRKREPEVRDAIFHDIISSDSWIIEDAGRECFKEGMLAADKIILLALPRLVLYRRVIYRWIKQRLGIEKSIYKPAFTMLRSMIGWIGQYDTSGFSVYGTKLVILKTSREANAYIKKTAHRHKR